MRLIAWLVGLVLLALAIWITNHGPFISPIG